MAIFGQKSMSKLMTCEQSLQTVMNEAIKIVDFSVIFGNREQDEQFELFQKGRKKVNGVWQIENKNEIVTFKDGYEKKSKHNFEPSRAVDIIPYPFPGWGTKEFNEQMHYIAGVVMAISFEFYKSGKIQKQLTWGGFWKNLVDLPHIEI